MTSKGGYRKALTIFLSAAALLCFLDEPGDEYKTVRGLKEETHFETVELSDSIVPGSDIEDKLKEINDGELPDLIPIDHFFYINLDEEIEKKEKMESWLSWFLPNRGIRFSRVPAMKGLPYICDFDDKERCIRESGLVDTTLNLIHSKKFMRSGVSLVLSDNFEVTDMHKLRMSANLVPDDWDIIRFDCYKESGEEFPMLNDYVFETRKGRGKFFGGSHAMLLRNDKLDRVETALNVHPRMDLDGALSWKNLNSYCVNVGVGHGFRVVKPRPLMHTFYSHLSNDDRDGMIDLWKQEWELAGFDTRILTLDDAKAHPYFETMKEAVEKAFPTDTYNQYCFYRYLAMATVGGFQSDFDTFPMHFPIEDALPDTLINNGQFTSFEGKFFFQYLHSLLRVLHSYYISFSTAHVPSLISASKEEWERVAILITEQLDKTEENFKSDMYMLRDVGLDESNNLIFLYDGVVKLAPYKAKGDIDCTPTDDSRVIHFSHHADTKLEESGLSPNFNERDDLIATEERTRRAQVFMEEWRKQCLD